MRNFVLIPLVLLMSGGCALPSPQNNAIGDARDRARQVGDRLGSGSVRSAQDVGHLADDMDGVEVMRVTGTTTARRDGVGLVVRVSGTAVGGWGGPETVTVTRCFELRVSPKTRSGGDEPHDVDCPHGAPLTFEPWPKTPEIPYERLRKALPRVPRGGTVDESKVRSAVDSLHLDPAIRIDVQAQEGMVGISLRSSRTWTTRSSAPLPRLPRAVRTCGRPRGSSACPARAAATSATPSTRCHRRTDACHLGERSDLRGARRDGDGRAAVDHPDPRGFGQSPRERQGRVRRSLT